jgi:hypothetical protein
LQGIAPRPFRIASKGYVVHNFANQAPKKIAMTDQKAQKASALVGWDNAPASKMGQPGRDVNNNNFPPLKAATNSIMTAMAKSMMA